MRNLVAEFGLIALGFALMVLDLVLKKAPRRKDALFHAAWVGLAAIIAALLPLYSGEPVLLLEIYRLDSLGALLRLLFVGSALMTVIVSRPYFTTGADGQVAMRSYGEFLYLIIFASAGMCAAISARGLVTLFVGIELATVPLYVLASYNKLRSVSAEAGAKYILFGSVSTAFMLMGCSYLYGMAHSLNLDDIGTYIAANPSDPIAWAGVFFVLGAIGFKVGLFPFHMWVPDVYDGAPTPTTAFLTVSSKIVGLSVLGLLVFGPFHSLRPKLDHCLLLLSATSMVVGNLGALRQESFRRFIGYSSIAQGGYFLMALVGQPDFGYTAMLWYLGIYGISNYAVFLVFSHVGRKRGENLDALVGLSKESPFLAGVLALSMFSLAGIPPAAGFTGKFMLFAAAAENGHYAYVIFAAINSTISLYYYLQITRRAYIKEATSPVALLETPGVVYRWVLLALAVAMIILGVYPGVGRSMVSLGHLVP